MSFPIRNRLGIQKVLQDVLQELATGVPLTIAELSRKVKADRRTISKVLDIIDQIQKTLETVKLIEIKHGNSRVFRFVEENAKKAISKAKKRG